MGKNRGNELLTAQGRPDSSERVGVVVDYHAAPEKPLAVLHKVAFVATGRELSALAVAGDQYEQVAGGARPLVVDLGRKISDHVAELSAVLALFGEASGKGADGLMSGDDANHRAFEHRIRSEAADDRLDIAAIERGRIAHEQIVDRQPIFDRRHCLIAWRKRCRPRP